MSDRLDVLITEAARAAAKADVRHGGVRYGTMVLGLLAKALRARQAGVRTKDVFAAQYLTADERAFLGW